MFLVSGKPDPDSVHNNSGEAADTTEPATKDLALKDESKVLSDATEDQMYLQVVKFSEEEPVLKWFLRIISILLIVCLLCLWIYYR